MTKISIIIPVKNRADTIEKAIQSVIQQSHQDFELIILDAASDDGTIDIIKRYADHLTYWHSERDKGCADATNKGIQIASGDLIALLMADDWYEPDTLQKIADTYAANPDADIITCGGQIVRYDEKSAQYHTIKQFKKAQQLKLDFYNICFGASAICCRFITKRLYNQIGLYITQDDDGKQFLTNDKEFLLRAMLYNVKDIFVNHLGYTYFAHHESYSFGNHRTTALKHCHEHLTIAKMYLSKPELPFKQKLFLHFWYNEQSAHLFLHKIVARNWRAAFAILQDGLQKYFLLWPAIFLYTSFRLTVKRVARLVL